MVLQKVGGAGHAQWATVQNMRVDHCGADGLDAFQEAGGEGVPKGIAGGWCDDS